MDPLDDAMAYMAVAMFWTHPRPLTVGAKWANPIRMNYLKSVLRVSLEESEVLLTARP